jgi:hypothetical protein
VRASDDVFDPVADNFTISNKQEISGKSKQDLRIISSINSYESKSSVLWIGSGAASP